MARAFPMKNGPPITWGTAQRIYQAYSFLYGQAQSLERMAERGGFGWAEVRVLFEMLEKRNPQLYAELVRMPDET